MTTGRKRQVEGPNLAGIKTRKLVFLGFEGVVSGYYSYLNRCECETKKQIYLDGIGHTVCENVINFLNWLNSQEDVTVVWGTECGHPVTDFHKETGKMVPNFPALESPRRSKRWKKIVEISEGFEQVFVVMPEREVGVSIRTKVEDSERFQFVRTDERRGLCGSSYIDFLKRSITKN